MGCKQRITDCLFPLHRPWPTFSLFTILINLVAVVWTSIMLGIHYDSPEKGADVVCADDTIRSWLVLGVLSSGGNIVYGVYVAFRFPYLLEQSARAIVRTDAKFMNVTEAEKEEKPTAKYDMYAPDIHEQGVGYKDETYRSAEDRSLLKKPWKFFVGDVGTMFYFLWVLWLIIWMIVAGSKLSSKDGESTTGSGSASHAGDGGKDWCQSQLKVLLSIFALFLLLGATLFAVTLVTECGSSPKWRIYATRPIREEEWRKRLNMAKEGAHTQAEKYQVIEVDKPSEEDKEQTENKEKHLQFGGIHKVQSAHTFKVPLGQQRQPPPPVSKAVVAARERRASQQQQPQQQSNVDNDHSIMPPALPAAPRRPMPLPHPTRPDERQPNAPQREVDDENEEM